MDKREANIELLKVTLEERKLAIEIAIGFAITLAVAGVSLDGATGMVVSGLAVVVVIFGWLIKPKYEEASNKLKAALKAIR